MFERSNQDSGIPGLSGTPSDSTVSGLPGSTDETESTATPSPSTGTTGGLGPSTPWEVGPWTIRLFVIAFVAAYAVLFMGEERARLKDPARAAARGEITPRSQGSLLRPANLRHAIRAAQGASPKGMNRLESLRITATAVDVTLSRPDGAHALVHVDAGFQTQSFSTGAQVPEGLTPSQVPTEVPLKLLRRADAKLHLKPSALDYILLNTGKDFDGHRRDSWGMYYSRPLLNNDAAAALDGTDVRLIGTPDAKTRAQLRRAQEMAARIRREAGAAR